MHDDRYGGLELLQLFVLQYGMEGLELFALVCTEEPGPERFEFGLVGPEDMSELAAVVAVNQPDDVGWGRWRVIICPGLSSVW